MTSTVHFLWVYGSLGKLELLSISSFLKHNYKPILWSYSDKINAPSGVEVQNANQIVDKQHIFLNQSHSYASFSDLFRYSVLSRFGGLWADTDVICLRDVREKPSTKFLVKEATKNSLLKKLIGRPTHSINNNVIYNPDPTKGDLIDLAKAISDIYPRQKITWAELGPNLLTKLLLIDPLHGFELKDINFANPIPYWMIPHLLLTPGRKLPASTHYLHCYNERWKINGISKEDDYPQNSILYNLKKCIFND